MPKRAYTARDLCEDQGSLLCALKENVLPRVMKEYLHMKSRAFNRILEGKHSAIRQSAPRKCSTCRDRVPQGTEDHTCQVTRGPRPQEHGGVDATAFVVDFDEDRLLAYVDDARPTRRTGKKKAPVVKKQAQALTRVGCR